MSEESQSSAHESNIDPALPYACDKAWCHEESRFDSTTATVFKHPDDFHTWHRGRPASVQVDRPGGASSVEASLQWCVHDQPSHDDRTPEIVVEGDDGSGAVCRLEVPVEAAERLARVILDLAEEARR